MDDNIKELKDSEGEAGDSAHKTAQHRRTRSKGSSGAWIPGLIFIALGVFFLLRNYTDFELENWWALFILIPAFGALGNFWRSYRSDGRMTGEATGSLIGALLLGTVAAIFLLGLSWGMMWPVFLIIAGLGALFSGMFGS